PDVLPHRLSLARALPSFPTRRSSDLDHGEVRRRRFRRGLLDDAHHAIEAVGHRLGLDDTVLKALFPRDLLHGNHRRLVALEYLRSEEHTSELQSPYDLVCRHLLEKKN